MATKKSEKKATETKSEPKAVRTVTLKNRLPRMLVLNLDVSAHRLKRRFPVVRQLRNGSSVGEMVVRLCPDSITFLAKETKSVPVTVLEATDVKNAIAAKKLVVIENRAH